MGESVDPLPQVLSERLSLDAVNQIIVECRRCPRLVAWREEVARTKRRAFRTWEYWGRPVPGFGDPQARLLIVGLAPAAHGGNRTGRVFTGDSSGDFLFSALFRAGFANQPEAVHRDDGLALRDVYVTAACRCAPPGNKPAREEMSLCRPYLLAELSLLNNLQGIVALGRIGFETIITAYRSLGLEVPRLNFGHGTLNSLGDGQPWLLASYHPSQQNTQTGRLTPAMFDNIWQKARDLLKA
ncbi:MAG: uracil-DNA glycosylase [Anaerolineaceae bacterium]|nr:uracil-DNA glycosylase [Anaerolineaceae bacterium]